MIVIESSQVVPSERILIVGDLLIDRTYYVDVSKISPEAPVPVAMLTGDPIDTPGGAGLAAAFAAVNNIPIIFGTYTSLVTARNISIDYKIPLVYSGDTYHEDLNAIKIRYIDNERYYHLLRVDNDRIIPPPFKVGEESKWFNRIEKILTDGTIKILVLLDYRKGLLTEARSQRLINIAHRYDIPVYVDSRSSDLSKFRGVDILKLNNNELTAARQRHNNCPTYTLAKRLNAGCIIETLGKEGANIIYPNGRIINYELDLSKHEGSPDVTGCGDVFDVTFCYYWGIKKIELDKALIIAVERATKFAYEPIKERLTRK